MLTLEEILDDVSVTPPFRHLASVEVDSRGANGETPLHWMATLGDANAIIILLNNGVDIDEADNDGNTPLHEAIMYCQAHAAKVLIEYGASTSIKNVDGISPEEMAKRNSYALTQFLFNQKPEKWPRKLKQRDR